MSNFPLEEQSQKRLLEARKVDYFVRNSPGFQAAWSIADDIEKRELTNLVEEGSCSRLIDYVEGMLSLDLESMKIRDLRIQASLLKIKSYWALSKGDLILRIMHARACRRNAEKHAISNANK